MATTATTRTMATPPTSRTQAYSIAYPAKMELTIQLLSGGDSLTYNGQPAPFTIPLSSHPGSATVTLTTPADDPWAEIEVTVTYPEQFDATSSTCHLYLKAEGENWLWKVITYMQGDNDSIVANGPGPSTSNSIQFQMPTAANPTAPPSEFQALDPSVVFLLDWNRGNGNMLFRGNEPLAPVTSNQLIDFQTLHQVLLTRYEQQTGRSDFPSIGSYVLRELAFLGPDEKPTLDRLLLSYGGTPGQGQLDNQAWYPPTATPLPHPAPAGMLAQLSNWNVEPSADAPGQSHPVLDLDVQCAQQLATWMNQQDDQPHIYYIHCASGHERTGMESAGYFMAQYQLAASEAFILGTTIRYVSGTPGANIVQPCDFVGTSTRSNSRARCFPAGNPAGQVGYNQTVIDMYNAMNKVSNGALSKIAISGDVGTGQQGTPPNPAYVYPCYPWETVAVKSMVGWQSTGIAVSPKSRVTITHVLGQWTSNPKINGGNLFGPDGDSNVIATQKGYPLLNYPEGCLVGRFVYDDGTIGSVFYVGADCQVTPQQNGDLQLCINDDILGLYGAGLSDNVGAIMVKITIGS